MYGGGHLNITLQTRRDCRQYTGGVIHRQIADADVTHAFCAQRSNRSSADVGGRSAGRELVDQALYWHRHKRAQDLQGLRTRAAVIKHAEHPWNRHRSAIDLRKKPLHWIEIDVADDLRQI